MTKPMPRALALGLVLVGLAGLAACQPQPMAPTQAADPGPPAATAPIVAGVDLPHRLSGLMADLVTGGDRNNLRRPGYADAVAEFDMVFEAREREIDRRLAEEIAERLTEAERRSVAVWLEGAASDGFAASFREIYLTSFDEFQTNGASGLDTDDPATLALYGVDDPLMQRLHAAALEVAAESIADAARQRARADGE